MNQYFALETHEKIVECGHYSNFHSYIFGVQQFILKNLECFKEKDTNDEIFDYDLALAYLFFAVTDDIIAGKCINECDILHLDELFDHIFDKVDHFLKESHMIDSRDNYDIALHVMILLHTFRSVIPYLWDRFENSEDMDHIFSEWWKDIKDIDLREQESYQTCRRMLYDYIRGVKSGETSVSYMVEDIMRKTMEGRIVELKTDALSVDSLIDALDNIEIEYLDAFGSYLTTLIGKSFGKSEARLEQIQSLTDKIRTCKAAKVHNQKPTVDGSIKTSVTENTNFTTYPLFFRTDSKSITEIEKLWNKALEKTTKTQVIRFINGYSKNDGYFRMNELTNKEKADEFNQYQNKFTFTARDFENANRKMK